MKYFIYGAGANASPIIQQLNRKIELYGIVDADMNKWGKKLEGFEIYSLDDILNKNQSEGDVIKLIISVTNPIILKDIEKELKEKGLKKGLDFYRAEDFGVKVPTTIIPGDRKAIVTLPNGLTSRRSYDPRSFLVSKENKIYRIIKQKYAAYEKKIYNKCKDAGLFGKYIVNTRIVNDIDDLNGTFVLEHEYINTISFVGEYPSLMIKDYILNRLEFVDVLGDTGLALTDAHEGNTTWFNGRFIFYDFGAIDEGYTNSTSIRQIIEYLILPYLLILYGETDKGYMYLNTVNARMSQNDIQGYLNEKQTKDLDDIYSSLMYMDSVGDMHRVIDKLRCFINSYDESDTLKVWADYQDFEWDVSDNENNWSEKMHNVYSMLKNIKFDSVTDIAGNQGWYGAVFRDRIDRDVCIDTDQEALNKLWIRIKQDRYSNVVPIYMSVITPTPPLYWTGVVDDKLIRPNEKSAFKRYESELVIALAVIHHLAFRSCLTFEEIINILSAYDSKFLLVEFVDQKDQYITDWIKEDYEWYTKDNFESELLKKYTILKQMPSTPSITRTLYLCEKN